MTTGLILVFLSDFHHLMLNAVVDSYTLFIPGTGLPVADFSNFFTKHVAQSFALGTQLQCRQLCRLDIQYRSRIIGQVDASVASFLFGLPAQISIQVWVFTIVLSGMMLVFLKHFQDTYSSFLSL